MIGFQFLVAVYGGYFGAGIGILMLERPRLHGRRRHPPDERGEDVPRGRDQHGAVVVFVRDDLVKWELAWPMVIAAIVGGYLGARVARRLPAKYVRYAVIAIGFGLSAFYFIRRYS